MGSISFKSKTLVAASVKQAAKLLIQGSHAKAQFDIDEATVIPLGVKSASLVAITGCMFLYC